MINMQKTQSLNQIDNPCFHRAVSIWLALEGNPNKEQDIGDETENIVRSEMARLVIKEDLVRIPYRWFPLDAYTPQSNLAILEIRGANFTMSQLDELGPRKGAFIPQNKITYLQLTCGLTAGAKGRREDNHFHTGYFCYLLRDGIYYMTIQKILKKIFPEEGTTEFQVWRMKAQKEGVFFTSEHWTRLESDAKYPTST